MWDFLSTVGVDLRLDDNNLATGQIITTSADALVGATSITIEALPVGLLRGAVLLFDGAAMPLPVSASLSAAASVGATTISIDVLATQINSGAQARDSGVNAATAARMLVGCRKGTSKVKLYCNKRYDDSELATCGTVCDWATIYGAKWLCERRAQACPKSILKDWDEAKEEMQQVALGNMDLEDCGTRGTDWPSITNVIVNPAYDGMRVRVQRNISDGVPTAYGQFIDWNSSLQLWF